MRQNSTSDLHACAEFRAHRLVEEGKLSRMSEGQGVVTYLILLVLLVLNQNGLVLPLDTRCSSCITTSIICDVRNEAPRSAESTCRSTELAG